MLRYIYPGRIDMSWASSAPIRLYEQKVKSFDYYDRITKVADEALPGCSTHVRDTLYSLANAINTTNYITVPQDLGLCLELIPPYIRDDNMFLDEVNMVVATKFSHFNRHYYPPNHDSELYSWCRTFSDPTLDVNSKLQLFLSEYLDEDEESF